MAASRTIPVAVAARKASGLRKRAGVSDGGERRRTRLEGGDCGGGADLQERGENFMEGEGQEGRGGGERKRDDIVEGIGVDVRRLALEWDVEGIYTGDYSCDAAEGGRTMADSTESKDFLEQIKTSSLNSKLQALFLLRSETDENPRESRAHLNRTVAKSLPQSPFHRPYHRRHYPPKSSAT